MKFRLIEQLDQELWYHISPADFNKFKINEEGMHLSSSKKGSIEVAKNKNNFKDKGILYTIKLSNNLNPLYIDLDTMRWTAPNIAKLLIAKINNSTVEGASGEDRWDDESEVMNNYKYDLSPDLIHIDNLTKEDLPKLEEIANEPADFVGIVKIGKFLESKGYDLINYELAEDNQQTSRALMLWDPNKAVIVNKQLISINK